MKKHCWIAWAFMFLMGALISACNGLPGQASVATVIVTTEVIVTKEVEVIREIQVTPAPQPVASKELVVCLGQEPDSLYEYGGALPIARHVWQAIYDGPIDHRGYDYQPVILEKLPQIGEPDAVVAAVTVQAGDLIVNSAGEPVELAKGVRIRPSGCRANDCIVVFDGTPVEMDQMVVTFKLKPDIRWSDGEAVTADDSVYAFELVADPDTPADKFTTARTASYEAVDERTTIWHGLPGYIDHLFYTNFWSPKPRHLWQDQLGYRAAELLTADEAVRAPMGWGAFMIKEWTPGERIVLDRNPHYFRAAEGLPALERVIFRFVPDPNAAVAQLVSGDCDIVTQDTPLENLSELLLQLEEEKLLYPLFSPGTAGEFVTFGITPMEKYKRPNYFADVRIRQAIAYCLDRQRVVDVLLYGRTTTLNSFVPAQHPFYAGDKLAAYPYDPAKGQALLEEMGWVMGEKNVRIAQDIEGIPEGAPLAFTWQAPLTRLSAAYLDLYSQSLAQCGIQMTPKVLAPTEYFAAGPGGSWQSRQFDLGSVTWEVNTEPDCTLYLSEQIPDDDNGWKGKNTSGFSAADYDAACRKAITALPHSADSIAGYNETQRIFAEQLPALPLFMWTKLAAIRPDIKGVLLDPTEPSELWNIEAFDIGQ